MARMRVVSLNRWGEFRVQVGFELIPIDPKLAVTHTEMALPEKKTEFDRLMAMKLYDEYDIDGIKVTQ